MTAPVTQENYGKKIEYDPGWKGPLAIVRKQTDLPFIVSFGVYLALWIGISIYAFNAGNVKIDNNAVMNNSNDGTDAILHPLLAARKIAFSFILLAIFLSLTCIILLRWFARVIIFTAIFVLCAVLLGAICLFSFLCATDQNRL